MAVFKCKLSGNTVEFTAEHDIVAMRGHDGYEEVKQESEGGVVITTYPPKYVKTKKNAD